MAVSGLVGQAVRADSGVSRSNRRCCSAAPAPTQVSTQDHRAPLAAARPRRIAAADGPGMGSLRRKTGFTRGPADGVSIRWDAPFSTHKCRSPGRGPKAR